MKTLITLSSATLMSSSLLFTPSIDHSGHKAYHNGEEITVCHTKKEKGCVFRTMFGDESSADGFEYNTTAQVTSAVDKGLEWIVEAQLDNGGWGAGSHYNQNVFDPHAVNADPATTAMVGMALMRTGTTPTSGPYVEQLQKAISFLLSEVENTPKERLQITAETNTQIQTKLGQNIDAALTVQFFSNLMEYLEDGGELKERIVKSTNICADKIQLLQNSDGSFKGSGWAGVLQSAMFNNAIESAIAQGIEVNEEVLEKSREYQKSNYDAESGNVNTTKGAGIVLYSVSGSVRASAKQAREVREEVKKAKQDGRLGEDAEISTEALKQIGYSDDEAIKYATSYKVYESSKNIAQQDQVMDGFGNNGGEEFLSYLQTGESLIINQDDEWKKWYENTSGRLVSIQNNDGSWNGHHCITSPVFCTATTLLTLSINNDIDKLVKVGNSSR